MKEEFKDIKGYNGHYQVSNLGRVKSLKQNKEKFLKSNPDSSGYESVALSINNKAKTFKIHYLVAVTFLDYNPCANAMVINHINNNKSDDSVKNLEVVSKRKNTNKKHIKHSSKYTGFLISFR